MTRTITTLAAAGITLAALTGCVPQDQTGTPTPTTSRAPYSFTFPTTKTVAPVADPYSSTGTWKVPTQIQPGTYQVNPIKPGRTGYWSTCANLVCDPFDGMIDNELVSGPGYVVIPDTAVAIELRNVALTPDVQ